MVGDTEPRRRGSHRLGAAGAEQKPHRNGVDRLRQRFLQGYLTQVATLEVHRAPGADTYRRVQDGVVRLHALLERRQPDEGLEGGSRLATGKNSAVERALAVVPPTNHGAHRTGGAIDDHYRALAYAGKRAR